MFPASCMCACVCIFTIRDGKTDGRTDICVTASPCTFVCVPFKLKWPQKIASRVFSEWKFRVSFNLCGLNYSVGPSPVAVVLCVYAFVHSVEV